MKWRKVMAFSLAASMIAGQAVSAAPAAEAASESALQTQADSKSNTNASYTDPWTKTAVPNQAAKVTSDVDKTKFTHKEWTGETYTDVDGNQVKAADVYGINTEQASTFATTNVVYDSVDKAIKGAKDYDKAASKYVQFLTGKDQEDWSLVVLQNQALAQGLQRALQEKNRQVLCCKNIQETRQHLHQNQTDLLILDVNLPDGSGFDLLQEIRRTSDLPVILLTANDLEMDIVSGLEQGANDYITKPFSLAVLRARVNTQLRNRTVQMQKESTQNTQIWEGSIWKFDFTNMRFTVSGQEVELSKTEQKLLALLVQHAGMTVPRETLMDRIWTDGAVYVDENALSVAIKRLRDKLQAKEQIRTVYGIGYVWEV